MTITIIHWFEVTFPVHAFQRPHSNQSLNPCWTWVSWKWCPGLPMTHHWHRDQTPWRGSFSITMMWGCWYVKLRGSQLKYTVNAIHVLKGYHWKECTFYVGLFSRWNKLGSYYCYLNILRPEPHTKCLGIDHYVCSVLHDHELVFLSRYWTCYWLTVCYLLFEQG